MVRLDGAQTVARYESLDPEAFIRWVTDRYLEAVGGQLTDSNMGELGDEQHALLCYRHIIDEVTEGGFVQLAVNGLAPYVLEGPFPGYVKKVWMAETQTEADGAAMKKFSQTLYAAKREWRKNRETLSADLTDEAFMGLYEQLDELNNLGDDFLDDCQDRVSAEVAWIVRGHQGVYY